MFTTQAKFFFWMNGGLKSVKSRGWTDGHIWQRCSPSPVPCHSLSPYMESFFTHVFQCKIELKVDLFTLILDLRTPYLQKDRNTEWQIDSQKERKTKQQKDGKRKRVNDNKKKFRIDWEEYDSGFPLVINICHQYWLSFELVTSIAHSPSMGRISKSSNLR